MKIARKVVTVFALAALLCTLLATAAFAAGSGSLWLSVDRAEGTAVRIITDTVVTDGVVKLTYDSSVLTYESTEVTADYVAMYAVNAEEDGVVLISWVAPGMYTLGDEAVCLIRVNFSGTEESAITLTGTAHDAQGSELTFADAPDTAALADAIAAAEALDASLYTEDSYAAVAEALEAAKTVLNDTTATQAEVDSAEKALRDAIAELVKISADTGTEETKEPTEATTAKPNDDNGDNSQTGDGSMIWVVLAVCVLSAVGVVILLIKMKPKKGEDAK